MKSALALAALAIPLALAAGPVFAQQAATTAPATAAPANTAVVKQGRLEMTHGGWRASKIVGASVYNDQHNSIGDIDDLIIDQSGKVTEAVVSVGGFLGIGTKLVGVPFDQLRFEKQVENNGVNAAGTNAGLAPAAVTAPATTTTARPATAATTTAPATTATATGLAAPAGTVAGGAGGGLRDDADRSAGCDAGLAEGGTRVQIPAELNLLRAGPAV